MLFSVALHAFLIMGLEFGAETIPVAGISMQKVSIKLVGRRVLPEVPKAKSRNQEVKTSSEPERLPLIRPADLVVQEIPPIFAPSSPEVPVLQENIRQLDPDKKGHEDDASFTLGVVVARPLYRDNRPPEYPALARRRHWQGTVVLDVLVGRGGKVKALEIKDSSGYQALDKAAEEAVKDWQFEPGRKGIMTVDMHVLVPVRFSLK